MAEKGNNYLKIILEITNKASKTYIKFQEYKTDPKSFEQKEPQLFTTFQIVNKLLSGTKEKIDNYSNENNRSSQNSYTSREEHYKILECKTSDSTETIKINYKKLVKEYHPDVISGKDLPKPFIEFANKKFQEIHTAYEYIKKERNF